MTERHDPGPAVSREGCVMCDGSGMTVTSRAVHGCGGDERICAARCPVEEQDFEVCEWCSSAESAP